MFLPPPCPPASTAPREDLHGGLIVSSCGRCRRRSMPNRQNVGEPANYLFQDMNRSYPKTVREVTAASCTCSFSPNQCFDICIVCCGRTTMCISQNTPTHGVDVLLLCVSFELVIQKFVVDEIQGGGGRSYFSVVRITRSRTPYHLIVQIEYVYVACCCRAASADVDLSSCAYPLAVL